VGAKGPAVGRRLRRSAIAGLVLGLAAWGLVPGQDEPPRDPHRRRSTIYLTLRGAGTVVALSRDTGEILATIPAGRLPAGIAARPDGDRVYVAASGSHAILVIDGATRAVLDTVRLAHGAAPLHLALDPDGRTLYVAASGLDAVLALDAGSLLEIASIAVGRRPSRLALSDDGRRLYVLCQGSATVDIVDTATARVAASVPAGARPADLAIDPRSGTVYVVEGGAPNLHVLQEGAARSRVLSLQGPAAAAAFDAAARRLVLAMPAAGRIAIVLPASGAATKVIRMAEASRVALDPEGARLYALSARRGLLAVVNHNLGTVEREIAVGEEPWDLVLVP
jgi:YVTN family beta-propeller protein